jgi:predicted Zn-dependent peptidase
VSAVERLAVPWDRPLGAVSLSIHTGTADDATDLAGLAHVTELVVRGSVTRGASLAQHVQRLGGELVSRTGPERTRFEAAVPRERVAQLERLLEELATIRVEGSSVDQVRRTVLRERDRDAADPLRIVLRACHKLVFGDSGPGAPVLGTPEGLSAIGIDEVRRRVRDYADRHRVIAVVGGSSMTREARVGVLPPRSVPSQVSAPSVYVAPFAQQHVAVAVRTPARSSPAQWDTLVLAEMLGEGGRGRLHRRLRSERGLVYGVRALHTAYERAGLLVLHASALPETAREALDLLRGELMRIAIDLDEEEVRGAAHRVLGRTMMAADGSLGRAHAILELWEIARRPWSAASVASSLADVSAGTVRALAVALAGQVPAVATAGPLEAADLGLCGSVSARAG